MFNTRDLNLNKVTFKPIQSPGQKFEHYEIIQLDEIYIPPMPDNPTRSSGKDPVNIQALTQSLSHGINYNLMPPVVRRNSRIIDGKHYKYELIAGNHRMEALLNNKYDEWIFGIYEFAVNGYSYEDSVRTFQLMENDHNPALVSSEKDISNTITRMIAYGSTLVTDDEASIRRYVETYCKNKHGNARNAIVKRVLRNRGVYQDIVTYTAKDAFKWISDNTDYTVAGTLDRKRDKYGWTVLEGYQYEYVMNAVRKYAETGKESYFVCHTKAPTEKMDLDAKRINMNQVFEQLESDLVETVKFYNKHGRFPWQNEGFMAQNHKTNEKGMIKL